MPLHYAVLGEVIHDQIHELDLVRTKGLPRKECCQRKATSTERTEIAQSLFASMPVRGGEFVQAKVARDEYLPLSASATARVGMARPEGFEPPTT